MRPQVAVYYFPNYHVDPRNEKVHGKSWTEWELVKHARPRFPGHQQPRVPAWGHEDESAPACMARKIDAAADHGVDAFIFDWYWYNDGPFLERGLDKGFLHAANNRRLKFALMWANHDWVDIHPAKSGVPAPLLYPGSVTARTFETITDHVIHRYFRHPQHWCIEGRPYFSIYELYRLIQGLGGVEQTREALQLFRKKAVAAGFPDTGVHLNAVVWGVQILPNERKIEKPDELLSYLGFDSVTSYVWVHHVGLRDFPVTDYQGIADEAAAYWDKATGMFRLPYHPNVTMGWDASARTVQTDAFENRGYPFMPMMGDNTPDRFRAALARCRDFMAKRPQNEPSQILTINAWNEWTEGSYLEPDTIHGMAYLETIRDTFGTTRTAD